MIQLQLELKIGSLYLVGSENVLRGVFWEIQNIPIAGVKNHCETKFLKTVGLQINEFLRGKRRTFDLLIETEGSEFQKRVWRELLNIPYGETKSYKQIATLLGDKGASRAVGTAIAKNPLCIIVPCHRVILSDGALGGYSGGIEIKKKLLKLESLNLGRLD